MLTLHSALLPFHYIHAVLAASAEAEKRIQEQLCRLSYCTSGECASLNRKPVRSKWLYFSPFKPILLSLCICLSFQICVVMYLSLDQSEEFCPQMYLKWWSATGLTAAVFLIELDRFLAIRFPLKYPLFITCERSLGACAVAQLSSLAVTLAVRIASPDAFACCPIYTADQETQRDYFLLIVVIPYFVCFLLSFLCALYVVKALLAQTRRDKKVSKA